MAAKHLAPKGAIPTSEKYEQKKAPRRPVVAGATPRAAAPLPQGSNAPSPQQAGRSSRPQHPTRRTGAAASYAPAGNATSPRNSRPRAAQPRRRHPARTAVIAVVVVIAALGLTYAFVPPAQAAVNNLLQLQAQDDSGQDAAKEDAVVAADVSASSAAENSTSAEPAAKSNDTESATDDQSSDSSASDDANKQASMQPEPEPVDDSSPYDAAAAVTTSTTASGITITAAPGFESTTTASALETALTGITGKGYRASFVMYDLATGKGVSYNADTKMYPASSIKAAYCTWILESTGGQVPASTIENCLVNSSNEAFHTLIGSYGLNSYASWLGKFAPEASAEASQRYYPYISATGFANVWKEIYRYANAGEGGSALLAQCLAASNHSPMGGLLRSRYTVWSKPGWYPADGSGLQATNDAGIVFSDCGDYVYAIETNVPDDFSTVFPLVDALNATHGKICGGHSALYANTTTTVSGGDE